MQEGETRSNTPKDDGIEILDDIDSGLYGKVYRAIQQPLGRQVAVKIIKTDMNSADALAHAAPLARVNHPAIVTVHSVQGIDIPNVGQNVPAIVMEWIDGDAFGDRLTGEKFTVDEAERICLDVLDGIEHLHANGLCHLDLHIGNIIILPNGRAKIIDIDANKEISLARLSTASQEGSKAADIDYCRGFIFKAMRHSQMNLSVLSDNEISLHDSSTIADLRQSVEVMCQQHRLVETNHVGEEYPPQDEGHQDWLLDIAKAKATPDEVIALLDTQAYFDLLEMPYPTSRDGVLDRLGSEGLIIQNGQGWNITNLAAILLAKEVNAFSHALARKAPRFVQYEGVNKVKTKTEVTGHRGYAVGFGGLVDFIYNAAPQNEYLETAIRKEIKMFPKQAIRELVANALVHQDFLQTGASVMIEMYADRVEVSNPGVPAIPTERFLDEYRSRNERLADVMRRLGICEEKGSGIDKVVSAAELFQLPAPDFRVGEIRTTAVLFAHQDFAAMRKSDRIRACFQHCVLQYLSGKRMSNQSLRERFGLDNSGTSSATTSQVIAATKEAGLIKQDDDESSSTRYARYLPHWA